MKRDCIWMGAIGGIVAIGLGTGAARDRGDAAPAAPSPVVEYVDTAALASPGGVGAGEAGAPGAVAASSPTVTVYKSPTCGCCKKWVEHLRENGFEVVSHDVQDVTPIKERYGVTQALASCHTAVVDGYVVEGHVPASTIRRLLEERPEVVGIAVPGMPMGSPGMEGPRKDRYDVVSFDRSGRTQVYERH